MGLVALQRLFGLFSLGDVAVNLKGRSRIPFRITPTNLAAQYGDSSAVFGRVNEFAFPILFFAKGFLHLLQWLRKLCLKERMRNVAEGFFLRPPVLGFGAAIPKCDSVFQIADNDGIVGEFKECSLLAHFGGTQVAFVLDSVAFGEIARYFGEADQIAVGVSRCRDDDVCPKAGAVFSDTPALFFIAARLGGNLQLICGLAVLNVFPGIED